VSYDKSIFNWKMNHEMMNRRVNRHLITIVLKSRVFKTVFDHHHISTRRRTRAFIFDYININTSISLSFLLRDVVQIKKWERDSIMMNMILLINSSHVINYCDDKKWTRETNVCWLSRQVFFKFVFILHSFFSSKRRFSLFEKNHIDQ
jgi:hypothetical protein